ncbi:MAG: ketopantoate reductase family protein [Gammaproteobacteria bacterium]|nr:ketopantoate reductase family protein [Gammaproteobacteria bacterium]
MHFVILGAGALGTILGGYLQRAGHRVQLLARGARATLLEAQGLTIGGLDDFQSHCEIVRDPAAVEVADVLINTVKTYDSVAALRALTRLKPVLAFSVQNGVVKEEELSARFGRAKVLGAMADFSGELLPDGNVLFTRNIKLHLGELGGGTSERANALAAAIANAGINAEAVDNVESVAWSKYVGWLALMVLAVLSRQTTGQYLQDPDLARIAARMTRETARLASHLKIPLLDDSPLPALKVLHASEDEAVAVIQGVGAKMHAQAPAHRMSSLQDLLRARPLELEETVGYALRKAAEFDLVLPTVECCYRLVAAINRELLRNAGAAG